MNRDIGRRILIIGYNGSGKTTTAIMLGGILNIKVVHLDELYWNPGWIATPDREWYQIVKHLLDEAEWIIEGLHESTLDVRLASADTILFLDFPRGLCFWRAIKRHFQFLRKSRPGMAEDCPAKLEWPLLKKFWAYPVKKRKPILQKLRKLAYDKRVVIFQSQRQVDGFLHALHRDSKLHLVVQWERH